MSLSRPGLPRIISYALASKNPLVQNVPSLGKIFPIAVPGCPAENPNHFKYHEKMIQEDLA
jgi:hypothetical protein